MYLSREAEDEIKNLMNYGEARSCGNCIYYMKAQDDLPVRCGKIMPIIINIVNTDSCDHWEDKNAHY